MDDRDLAFHGLAIKRHASVEDVAGLIGMPQEKVSALLEQAVQTGRAMLAKGAYVLTPLARVALEARYGLHFADVRQNKAFLGAYETFERINTQLKQAITDWQTVDIGGSRVANDHSDPAHDEAVIDRIGAIHEQIEPVLATLAGVVPRMARHQKKLLAALEAAEDGDHEWVSDVHRESYHTVWFELHEDLLRIMGRVREE